MRNYPSIGIQVPDVLLPKPGTDLTKWAVIACDQFTSQPEYWQKVEEYVGDAPSTYNLILPEVYLESPGVSERVQLIQSSMRSYLDEGVLEPFEGLVYVERTVSGRTRKGLVLCLDLEAYDFNKGSRSLIRATEGTILDRLPPRIRIREGAPLELPHILVLIDDPNCTVLEPLSRLKGGLLKAYDFDLMMGSGHVEGYKVTVPALLHQVASALEHLADPQVFASKYGLLPGQPVLLFAMGDGNHSLATAKAIWERLKPQVGMDHPARYALVEIENVHDDGLVFEPIHRVLFGLKQDVLENLNKFFNWKVQMVPAASLEAMTARVDEQFGQDQLVGLVTPGGFDVLEIFDPPSNLPVGTLQQFLDFFLKQGGAERIDYVHGNDVVARLGAQPGCCGFYLPAMQKSDLFRTVILDGALPRKTFSMGEAHEKRFYLEARRIS